MAVTESSLLQKTTKQMLERTLPTKLLAIYTL